MLFLVFLISIIMYLASGLVVVIEMLYDTSMLPSKTSVLMRLTHRYSRHAAYAVMTFGTIAFVCFVTWDWLHIVAKHVYLSGR